MAVEEAFGGFYCDFSFSQPFSSEILVQLEERIRQIVRDKHEIRRMEMIPFSAAEWLKKMGQKHRSSQVLAQDGFVSLIQMGPFVDWCENPCGRHTGEAGILRLLNKEKIGKDCYRIFGIAALTKEELRSQSLLWKRFPEIDHQKRAIDQGYWEIIDGERIWLAPGLAARRKLADLWRENFSLSVLEVEGCENLLSRVSEKRGNIPVMQMVSCEQAATQERGLLDQNNSLALQINSFGDNVRDCISFLQIVHKSLNILGFTFRIRYFGKKRKASVFERALEQLGWETDRRENRDEPRLEFLIKDALQCEWAVVSMEDLRQKRALRLNVWIERNLALLLEKDDE